MRAFGVKSFRATSGVGYRFVCHLGDFLGENPFYNREAFRVELELCAVWLRQEIKPVIFDVGANVGFWCTHLAQMLRAEAPEIYAFEPVPGTFVKLLDTVERLGLTVSIHPVAAAVIDTMRPVRLSYSSYESLFAQVTAGAVDALPGKTIVLAAGLTLDAVSNFLGVRPQLIKIDVEGSEVAALAGAQELLQRADRPAVMFEYNPKTLGETGADATAFPQLLSGYSLYYVDDFEGQRLPFGAQVDSANDISWACNLFAVPTTRTARARWERTVKETQLALGLTLT